MIAHWVAHTPGAVALAQGDQCWRYAELGHGTARLTSALLAAGLRPGEPVAVSGRQSFGLIASMLAVLAGRGVMLTIDPNLPERRQRLLVEQAGAKRLLWAGPLAAAPDWIRQQPWTSLIEVDANTGSATSLTGNAWAEPEPDDPAYIFFTSGTTGVPKGVLGCHKGLSHFLTWQRDTFQVGPGDRVAQLTNLSFDVVLRAVFLALVSGGTLCLPPDDVNLTAESVLPWMQREKITLLHTVPSLAQTWLADVPAGVNLPSLRLVFFAGEPLLDVLVRRWRASFPTGQVVNLYGPTETTMAKFYYRVPAEPDRGVQPVGWPLPQTEAILLDNDEIGIRTEYRTLGYLNAPEEQQRRFVSWNGDVVYRTGDRGRFRADGALEILGRLDHQVKIQGVRIEPDEVSAAIGGHPSVKAVVVVARQEPGREPVLVAYVVATGLAAAELREFLTGQLPAAMVPTHFVFLDRLPLTTNGKVDRNALPAPPAAKPYVAPRTQLEQSLAGLWQQALGVAQVGVEDNFFELGGNSLRLAQVHGKLRTLLNRDVPIGKLFQYSTIILLAGYLGQTTAQPVSRAQHRAARQIAARTPQTREGNGSTP
jgi:amino acid adenylation domain-containing protein